MPTGDQLVRHATLDDRSIAWSSTGSGPVVVLGGWWSSHLQLDWENPAFRRFVQRLAATFTVVRYDRPGTGLADRGPVPHVLDEELAVLDAVVTATGQPRVHLFGGSSGCPIALAYAARHPERVDRLVLYGGYARGADIASPTARATMIDLIERHWGLGSRVLADVFLPGATARERTAFAAFQRRSASREVAAEALRVVYDLDVSAELPHINRPTLVLHRRDDRAIPAALGHDLAEHIGGAVFVELAGDSHFPWRGDSSSVTTAIERFLGGRSVTAPASVGPDASGSLTDREVEVLRLVARGLTDGEIAQQLVLSVHTVHRHIANIRSRLGVPSRSAAAALATDQGLL